MHARVISFTVHLSTLQTGLERMSEQHCKMGVAVIRRAASCSAGCTTQSVSHGIFSGWGQLNLLIILHVLASDIETDNDTDRDWSPDHAGG